MNVVTHREYLDTFTKVVNNFLHVHSVQIHRNLELNTVHAHSIESQVNAASCAKIKTDV